MEGGSKCSVNVQNGLKKGPWTAAEDAILMEYVRKHGEGNWNSVQKNSGLMRCGKSCRLRWANHLRPNLKKGSFTPDEERIIIDLHSKLGNKWARMASQLPGRTDNEIKNFWNTRMKRRQRAGLPIYPQEFHEDQSTTIHHHHQQQHQHQQQKHPNSSSSSSSPFSSFLSSRKPAYNPSLPFLDSINFSPTFDHHHFQNSFYTNPNLQFKPFENHHQPQPQPQPQHHHNNANNNNNTLTLPLSPLPHQYANSPQPCSSLSQFNQNFIDQSIPRTPPLMHYNNIDLENNMSFTSLIMGSHQNANFNIPPHPHELPSNQTPPRPNTPFSSNTNNSGGVCLGGGGDTRNTDQNEVEEECRMLPQIDHEDNRSNSGLLDTLLLESHNLLRKEKLNQHDDEDLSDKGKRKVEDDDQEEEDEEEGEEGVEEKEGFKRLKLSSTNSTNHSCDDISSSQSSIGMKPNEEPMEEMNSMDDDLLSLLDNFPSTTPLPEWYRTRNVVSEGMSSGTTGDGQEVVVEAQQDHDHETPNVEWGLGSSYWNNMPSIC